VRLAKPRAPRKTPFYSTGKNVANFAYAKMFEAKSCIELHVIQFGYSMTLATLFPQAPQNPWSTRLDFSTKPLKSTIATAVRHCPQYTLLTMICFSASGRFPQIAAARGENPLALHLTWHGLGFKHSSRTTTLLVFLSASTGTGIVTANLLGTYRC